MVRKFPNWFRAESAPGMNQGKRIEPVNRTGVL
jgi:hypothetical protein